MLDAGQMKRRYALRLTPNLGGAPHPSSRPRQLRPHCSCCRSWVILLPAFSQHLRDQTHRALSGSPTWPRPARREQRQRLDMRGSSSLSMLRQASRALIAFLVALGLTMPAGVRTMPMPAATVGMMAVT